MFTSRCVYFYFTHAPTITNNNDYWLWLMVWFASHNLAPRADFLKAKMRPEPIYGKCHDFTEKTKSEKMICRISIWFHFQAGHGSQSSFIRVWINFWMVCDQSVFKEKQLYSDFQLLQLPLILPNGIYFIFFFSITLCRFGSNSVVAISVGTLEWFQQFRYVPSIVTWNAFSIRIDFSSILSVLIVISNLTKTNCTYATVIASNNCIFIVDSFRFGWKHWK